MRQFLELAAERLWTLTVLWPAWLLTPEGLRRTFTWRRLRHLILLLILVAVTVTIVREMPWGAGVMLSGDMIAYLDVTLIALAASLVTRLRDVVRSAAALVSLLRPASRRSARARAPRPFRPRRPPSNDNEDRPALPRAA